MLISKRQKNIPWPIFKFSLAFFFVFLFKPSFSINLSDSIKTYDLSSVIYVFKDSTSALSITDIKSEYYAKEFKLNTEKILDFGLTTSAIWVRLDITNQSSVKNWVLDVDYRLIQYVDLYTRDSKGVYQKKQSGAGLPFNKRETDSRNIAFKIKCDSSETLFLRFESWAPLKIPLNLYSVESFYKKESTELSVFAVYYGIALLIIIINLCYFFYLKDTIFLYYCSALVAISIGLGTDNGLAFEYIWPNLPWFNKYANIFFAGMASFFLLGFVRKLLLSSTYAPLVDKVALVIQWLNIPINIIFPIFLFGEYSFLTGSITTVIGFPVFVYLGIKAWKAQYQPAKFYFIGWGFLATGVIIYVCGLFKLLPNSIGAFGIYIGSILEIIFFMLSIAVRYKVLLKQETDYKKKIEEYTKKVENQYFASNKDSLLPPDYFVPLSKREREVLAHMAIGLADKEIAECLFVSLTTIKTHARNIYNKLDVKSRTEAVAVANKYNLVSGIKPNT